MNARTAMAAGVAAASLIAADATGWTVCGWRADAAMVSQHALVHAGYADTAYQAGQAARAEEQLRIAALENLEHETQRQVAAAIADERRAADQRVQRTVDDYTTCYRGMAQRASGAIGMFAEVLSGLTIWRGVYAAQADRARVAGLGCEAAYDRVRDYLRIHAVFYVSIMCYT